MNKADSEPQLSTENIVKAFQAEMKVNKDFLGFTSSELCEKLGSVSVPKMRRMLLELARTSVLNCDVVYDKRGRRQVNVYSLKGE